MSYQLLPNLIFFISVLGVIVLILRRLPEAQNLNSEDLKKDTPHGKLEEKGIPAQSYNRLWSKIKFYLHKLWSLALDAKDLRPKPGAYQLKKLFLFRTKVKQEPIIVQKTENLQVPKEINKEAELFELIRLEPKERRHYDDLGKYYLTQHKYQDAKDIYLYLVGHEVGNPNFHAKLAQCAFHLKEFALAESHFQKSLELDKMHPNRYYNLGLAQECQEKWEKALDSFSKAVEMQPENTKYTLALEKAKKQLD